MRIKVALATVAILIVGAWAVAHTPSDPQDKVADIRRDIFKVVDVATIDRKIEHYPKSLDELISIYESDSGGVWCAGAAYTLQKAYEDAGYESWVLSYGFVDRPGYLTHASTLVRVGGEIYLQDAYLNFDYPVPFNEVIDGLLAGEPVAPRKDEATRDVLLAKENGSISWALSEDAICSDPDPADGVHVCQSEMSLDLFVGNYMSKWSHTYDLLESLGNPRDVQYILLYPFAIYQGHTYTEDPSASPVLKQIVEQIGRPTRLPALTTN